MRHGSGLFKQPVDIAGLRGGPECPLSFEITATRSFGGGSWTTLGAEGSPMVRIMIGKGAKMAAGESRYAAETLKDLKELVDFLSAHPEIASLGSSDPDDAMSGEWESYEEDVEGDDDAE